MGKQELIRLWARAFRVFALISLGFTAFGLLIYSGNWFVSLDDLSMTPPLLHPAGQPEPDVDRRGVVAAPCQPVETVTPLAQGRPR